MREVFGDALLIRSQEESCVYRKTDTGDTAAVSLGLTESVFPGNLPINELSKTQIAKTLRYVSNNGPATDYEMWTYNTSILGNPLLKYHSIGSVALIFESMAQSNARDLLIIIRARDSQLTCKLYYDRISDGINLRCSDLTYRYLDQAPLATSFPLMNRNGLTMSRVPIGTMRQRFLTTNDEVVGVAYTKIPVNMLADSTVDDFGNLTVLVSLRRYDIPNGFLYCYVVSLFLSIIVIIKFKLDKSLGDAVLHFIYEVNSVVSPGSCGLQPCAFSLFLVRGYNIVESKNHRGIGLQPALTPSDDNVEWGASLNLGKHSEASLELTGKTGCASEHNYNDTECKIVAGMILYSVRRKRAGIPGTLFLHDYRITDYRKCYNTILNRGLTYDKVRLGTASIMTFPRNCQTKFPCVTTLKVSKQSGSMISIMHAIQNNRRHINDRTKVIHMDVPNYQENKNGPESCAGNDCTLGTSVTSENYLKVAKYEATPTVERKIVLWTELLPRTKQKKMYVL